MTKLEKAILPLEYETYVFDFSPFQLWADIVKFFIFVGYIFGLIKLTRGIIG